MRGKLGFFVRPRLPTYVWDFGNGDPGTLSPSSGLADGLTVSEVSRANNNGTLSLLLTSTASPSNYTGASGGNLVRAGVVNGSLNTSTSTYFEFTLTPASGYTVAIDSLSFGTRATSFGPTTFSIRSSADSYAADLDSDTIQTNSTWAFFQTDATVAATASPLTVRIYGYGSSTASSGQNNWQLDDLTVRTTVAQS